MGDFGIAKVLECTIAVARTQIGTPYYLSPELCKEQAYTTPSDIWAMGCILYEMCALKVPFDAASIPKLVQAITGGRIPEVPSGYSNFTRNLVKEMLNRDPNKRPGCDEILQRPEIQAVVRSMVSEAQDKEAKVEGAADKAAAPAAAPKAVDGPYKDSAGIYKKNDLVEFWSNSHQSWLPAVVVNIDAADGRLVLDLKPNTWMTKDQQANSVRPRTGGGVSAVPPRAVASPMRRSPSSGGVGTPRRSQSPSAGGRPGSQGGRPGSRGASPGRGAVGQPMSARGAAGTYRNGDLVEFWSNSHSDWLPAQVTNTDAAGRILIDLKPNTWITKDEQSVKIRPRKTVAAIDRPSSANRRPPVGMGASPQLARPPLHRTPSWGNDGPDRNLPGIRAPSPSGGRAMTPLRAPSPSGGRAMTPLGGRAASPSGRALTPGGRPMTPSRGRAASPGPGGYMNRPPRVAASPLRNVGGHIAGLQ